MDKIKQKVLEELIAEMEGREMNGLKSGKEMSKVEVMAEEPDELAEGLSMAEKMVKAAPEESFESDETKSPMESEEMNPEMLKKLMEMYSQLK